MFCHQVQRALPPRGGGRPWVALGPKGPTPQPRPAPLRRFKKAVEHIEIKMMPKKAESDSEDHDSGET